MGNGKYTGKGSGQWLWKDGGGGQWREHALQRVICPKPRHRRCQVHSQCYHSQRCRAAGAHSVSVGEPGGVDRINFSWAW